MIGRAVRPAGLLDRLVAWLSGTASPEAVERSEQLLGDLLGSETLAALRQDGYVEIPSTRVPGRTHRVQPGSQPVTVLESGQPTERLCLQPTRPLPGPDMVLLHVLLIRADEAEYLRQAHRIGPVAPDWVAYARW